MNNNKLIIGENYYVVLFLKSNKSDGTQIELSLDSYYRTENNIGGAVNTKFITKEIGTMTVNKDKGYMIILPKPINISVYKDNKTKFFNDPSITFELKVNNSISWVERNSVIELDYTSNIITNFTTNYSNNQLELDASSSVSPDNTITSYIWKDKNGNELASSSSPTTTLSYDDLVVSNNNTQITLETTSLTGYTGSKTIIIPNIAKYSWENGDWSSCIGSNGNGTKTRIVECKDANGNTVNDNLCTDTKPDDSESCQYQIDTSKFAICASSRIYPNTTLSVSGSYVSGNLELNFGSIDSNDLCTYNNLFKPTCTSNISVSSKIKFSQENPINMSIENFDGDDSATVSCFQDIDGVTYNGSFTLDGHSTSNNITYSWEVGNWGSCNDGTQTRTVLCKSSSGSTVNSAFCSTSNKPLGSQSCTGTDTNLINFLIGNWKNGISESTFILHQYSSNKEVMLLEVQSGAIYNQCTGQYTINTNNYPDGNNFVSLYLNFTSCTKNVKGYSGSFNFYIEDNNTLDTGFQNFIRQ